MASNGHLPLFDIYYTDGALLGSMALSEKSQALLDEGEPVSVIYHTPQLLRDKIGPKSGHFVLEKRGEHITTTDPQQFNEFMQLQTAIATARVA